MIDCARCERTGKMTYLFTSVLCVECKGNGYFTLEHLKQVRAGRSVKRNRQRYWLKIGDIATMFGLSVTDWRRVEYGHFAVGYTLDAYHALKRYTDSLEKLPFYTLIRNPKNRRQGFAELLSTYNKVLIDKEVERLELKPKEYQVVVQDVYAEQLK